MKRPPPRNHQSFHPLRFSEADFFQGKVTPHCELFWQASLHLRISMSNPHCHNWDNSSGRLLVPSPSFKGN